MYHFFSPAKINLFLRIVSKQSNGFHHLSSLFQAVSLGDTLTVSLDDKDLLTCSNSSLPLDGSNLILKAIDLFRRKSGYRCAFKIHLTKRIPMQAGLGGGSSNAATMLWACNEILNAGISTTQLQQWGAELGSDVPFFFSEGTAHCTGRGECVHSLPALSNASISIIKPPYGLPTKDVFEHLNYKSVFSPDSIQQDLNNCIEGNIAYFNMLEKAAFELRPQLAALKNQLLQAGFKAVIMSGSGSSLVCIGENMHPLEIQENHSLFPVSYIRRTSNAWYVEKSKLDLLRNAKRKK